MSQVSERAAAPPRGGKKQKSTTIYDIARIAEVSHQSVSRYMRGLSMRPGTKTKIQKALETLDYKPNLSARALITGRSLRIGALTHEVRQVGPSMIIQGATAAAREAGYLLDVVTLDMGDVAEINQALETLTQFDLAGIIAFASTDSTRAVFEDAGVDVPLVIASEQDEQDSTSLHHAATLGIDAAIDCLAQLGHRVFLHVAGPADWSAARNRSHAYEAAINTRGLTSLGVLHGDWSAKSGHDAIAAVPTRRLPTAVVAANDQMALGVMHALHARGIRVPEKISVTGVDDTPEASYFIPSLTTVPLSFHTQGRDALRQLLDEIGAATSPVDESDEHPQKPLVVVRDSIGPAAQHTSRPMCDGEHPAT